MKYKVYVDGQEGTTGLKINERLAERDDIEILKIDSDKRKDAEERKKFRKMGPKSVDYVNENLLGANQFPGSLPSDFPVEEFANDVDAINKLYPLLVASQALTEALNDTLLALSSDAMKEADEVYGFLKIASKRDANAKALVEQIARRFKGQGKKKPE